MANNIEKWARSRIHTEKLNDTVETYEFLISGLRGKLGLSPHMNELAVLEELNNYISKPAKPDTRGKIKKIRESIKQESEKEKLRLKSQFQKKEAGWKKKLELYKNLL